MDDSFWDWTCMPNSHPSEASGAHDPSPLLRSSKPRRHRAGTVHTIVGLPGVSWRPVVVNGGSGALFLDGQEKLIGVMALDIAGSQSTNIQGIVNPDKLAHLDRSPTSTRYWRPLARNESIDISLTSRPGRAQADLAEAHAIIDSMRTDGWACPLIVACGKRLPSDASAPYE